MPIRRAGLAVTLLAGLALTLTGAPLAVTPPAAPTIVVPTRAPADAVSTALHQIVAAFPAPTTRLAVAPRRPILDDLPRRPAAPDPPPAIQLAGAFPQSGPGTFAVEPTRGPVLGAAGSIRRFRVAVERGVAERPAEFAAAVDEILGDPRSWIGTRRLRLQRVPAGAPHDFTLYLATPGTAAHTCARGGVDIRVGGKPFTSCRAGPTVVINLARWRLSAPSYVSRRIPLTLYRQYVINHEVGHQLGNWHVRCPGPGRPAPVMMQQTLGLGRCAANPWPYLNGRRYSGPSL